MITDPADPAVDHASLAATYAALLADLDRILATLEQRSRTHPIGVGGGHADGLTAPRQHPRLGGSTCANPETNAPRGDDL
jgi:hypothetical protein